ncbi:hypothetical protein [Afipia sp. DC4300-2b1]|uniref:hypothetical protein n=1 Tax=Afipia sp. DC4300-2b1 TaxID=2804672 RepID=UPI003CE8287A
MSLSARRMESLEVVDIMPAELRECVHEFGLPIVTVCRKHGINSKRAIREVVREIWAGARQTGQRNDTRGTLDWLLMRGGASAKTLYRVLAENNMAIVSVEPTRAMIDASMAEVSGFAVRCTKEEKHKRRLRAALRASMAEMVKSGVHV